MRSGLPHAEALRAVTETPAEIFGLEARGKLEKGALANLAVFTGDPLETATRVARVVIRGREQPSRDRQRRLLERWRRVPLEGPPHR